jgi:hypothetical protein
MGNAQNEGFYVPPDTLVEGDTAYLPTVKARLFSGKPGRAALYSLILPGAGQAYNKKYWQVPIVWAGVGTAGVIMVTNAKEYRGFRDAYNEHLIAEMEGRPVELEGKYVRYSKTQLLNERDRWNRYRQLSIIAFAAVWLANSAQAYVQAHLQDFDVSEDLSFQLLPVSGDAYGIPLLPVAPGLVWKF